MTRCINCYSRNVHYSSKSTWHGNWLMCMDCDYGWCETDYPNYEESK